MKLRTKLTVLCAAALFLTAAALSAAMLWQVREQSYENLTQRSQEQLSGLVSDFSEAINLNGSRGSTARARNAVAQYCFRAFGVEGSILAADGELLFNPTGIDPRDYMTDLKPYGITSVRCTAGGQDYLIVGCVLQRPQLDSQIYLVTDATFIRQDLRELLLRFLCMALCICGLGLLGIWLLIRRTLTPLSQLQEAADRIAAGNYTQRANGTSRDEVGLLAENFNRMAEAVEVHIQTLTEQNARQQLFIGSVTHEFKTPLTSLLLNVDTLRTVYLPEEKQAELLDAMSSQLRWLEQMVQKLLKLMTPHKSARIGPSSVPALLAQVEPMAAPIMEKYHTVLEISCAMERLSMDPDLMCSALINLIENSARASAPGQWIRLRAAENTLSVSDSGRGIPREQLGRVTEPFYMGDPSRSKANDGFGLGLALVKEIAAVHGAVLELESTPGAGTTARLVFPASCQPSAWVLSKPLPYQEPGSAENR